MSKIENGIHETPIGMARGRVWKVQILNPIKTLWSCSHTWLNRTTSNAILSVINFREWIIFAHNSRNLKRYCNTFRGCAFYALRFINWNSYFAQALVALVINSQQLIKLCSKNVVRYWCYSLKLRLNATIHHRYIKMKPKAVV